MMLNELNELCACGRKAVIQLDHYSERHPTTTSSSWLCAECLRKSAERDMEDDDGQPWGV